MKKNLIVLVMVGVFILSACTLPSGADGKVGIPNFQATSTSTNLPFASIEIPKESTPTPIGKVDISTWWDENEVKACFTVSQIGSRRNVYEYLFYEIVVNGKSYDHGQLLQSGSCVGMDPTGVVNYKILINNILVIELIAGQQITAGTIYIMP